MKLRRSHQASVILAIVTALLLPVEAGAGEPENTLKAGLYSYEHGDYSDAIKSLSSILDPMKLTNVEDIITARKYLGASYFFAGRQVEASQEFKKLLMLRPDYTMDPFLFPPPLVMLFDNVREEVKKMEQKAGHKEPVKKTESVSETTGTVIKNSFYVNFIPFGAPQFQNGHTAKGWSLFGVDLALLGLNIASYWTAQSFSNSSGYYPTEQSRSQARTWSIVQIASIATFGAMYIYGLADGIYYYTPETVIPAQQPAGKQN